MDSARVFLASETRQWLRVHSGGSPRVREARDHLDLGLLIYIVAPLSLPRSTPSWELGWDTLGMSAGTCREAKQEDGPCGHCPHSPHFPFCTWETRPSLHLLSFSPKANGIFPPSCRWYPNPSPFSQWRWCHFPTRPHASPIGRYSPVPRITTQLDFPHFISVQLSRESRGFDGIFCERAVCHAVCLAARGARRGVGRGRRLARVG